MVHGQWKLDAGRNLFKFHDDVECTLVEVELRWCNKNEIGCSSPTPSAWGEGRSGQRVLADNGRSELNLFARGGL